MVSNSEFLDCVYGELGSGIHGWTASFRGDPNAVAPDVWSGSLYVGTENQRVLVDKRVEDNNYYCVARLKMNGAFRRSKSHFEQLAVLVADDADPSELNGTPSFVVETSPGKHQIGVLLDQDDPQTRDAALIDAVMQAMADARLIKADASGNNAVRYCRLPVGINGKGGRNAQVNLRTFDSTARYSLEDALAIFGLDLDAVRSHAARNPQHGTRDVPSDAENAELVRRILSGDSYHDPLVKLSAKLVASGASGGAVVNHLRGLMEACQDRSERWQSRYQEIPRMVQGAERFRPEAPSTVTINLSGAVKPAPSALEPAPMVWAELARRPPEPATFYWEGWLPARTTTLLSANGGVGKSNLSLQLAAALALGGRFLGHELAPRRVLVVSCEDEARTVHFRLANILTDLGVELGELEGRLTAYDLTQVDCVLWREGRPTARMQWLADVVEQHQADVVILDNASDVFNSNENDRAEVRGFMRSLNAIAHHSGAAMLLLAHVDKANVRSGAGSDSNSTFSGSTAWNNSARSRWAMTREDDVILLKHEKCNLGPLQGQMRLEFDAAAKVFRKFGEVQSAAFARQVVRNSQRVAILKQIEKAIRVGQKMSMAPTSNNNVYTVLNGKQTFPQMSRKEFFAELMSMQRDELIIEREYRVRGHDRKEIVLTPAGEEMVLRAV